MDTIKDARLDREGLSPFLNSTSKNLAKLRSMVWTRAGLPLFEFCGNYRVDATIFEANLRRFGWFRPWQWQSCSISQLGRTVYSPCIPNLIVAYAKQYLSSTGHHSTWRRSGTRASYPRNSYGHDIGRFYGRGFYAGLVPAMCCGTDLDINVTNKEERVVFTRDEKRTTRNLD